MTSIKSYLAILLSSLFFISCASTHPGVIGKSIQASPNLNLQISAQWNRDYSDDSNIFVDFTFQNLSGTWAHIDQVDVDFPNDSNTTHNMIVGNDLKAWADSFTIRKRKEDHNFSMGVAGLIATGAILMVAAAASGGRSGSSSSNGLAIAGASAYTLGTGAAVVRGVSDKVKSAERGFTVPESHILAPVTIPSSGFAQRWLIVNIPAGVKAGAKMMRLRIRTVEGGEGIFEIPLIKNPGPRSRT